MTFAVAVLLLKNKIMSWPCTKIFNNIRQAQLFLVYARLRFLTFGHHQAFLHYESIDAIYTLGSQYVYSDKIYNSVTSIAQVEVMCVYITVCSFNYTQLYKHIHTVNILGSQRVYSIYW